MVRTPWDLDGPAGLARDAARWVHWRTPCRRSALRIQRSKLAVGWQLHTKPLSLVGRCAARSSVAGCNSLLVALGDCCRCWPSEQPARWPPEHISSRSNKVVRRRRWRCGPPLGSSPSSTACRSAGPPPFIYLTCPCTSRLPAQVLQLRFTVLADAPRPQYPFCPHDMLPPELCAFFSPS